MMSFTALPQSLSLYDNHDHNDDDDGDDDDVDADIWPPSSSSDVGSLGSVDSVQPQQPFKTFQTVRADSTSFSQPHHPVVDDHLTARSSM